MIHVHVEVFFSTETESQHFLLYLRPSHAMVTCLFLEKSTLSNCVGPYETDYRKTSNLGRRLN